MSDPTPNHAGRRGVWIVFALFLGYIVRLSLARSVLATVGERLPQASADDVISAMKARYPRLFAQSDTQKLHDILDNATSDRPPPTDAAVKQWIDERRMEKYGL